MAIHEQHERLSGLHAELIGSVEKIAEFQRSILGTERCWIKCSKGSRWDREGEVFDIKTFAYYGASLALAFAFTSFSATRRARWNLIARTQTLHRLA